MSKDGRLTIRFGKMLEQIEALAKQAERKPSDWIKSQLRPVIRKKIALNKARDEVAA